MSLIKKKLFLNKTLVIGLAVVLFSSFSFSDKEVEAATVKPPTGSADYSLLDDDGKTFVPSDKIVFQNLSEFEGGIIDYKSVWRFGYNSGVNNGTAVLKSGDLKPGKYAITAKIVDDLKVTSFVTSFVTIKASTKATKVKAIALPGPNTVDPKKSGKISGHVSADATVIIKNKTTAWTTKANGKGVFKVYVPAGTYDIIVDPDGNNKNIKYSIKVLAGQNNSPFKYEAAGSKIDLGYEIGKDKAGVDSINPASKEYKGKAIPNSTVKAYSVVDNIYTLIGETVTKKATKGSTTGNFSIKLKAAQPGKNIKIVVEDVALNSYSTDPISLGLIDPGFTPMKNAVVGKDVSIPFADKSGALLTAATDLAVTIEGKVYPLTKILKVSGKTSGDYKISSGKITISNQSIIGFLKNNQKAFESDIDFTITVKAPGFKDSTFVQTIKAANAPSLTASVTKASIEGVQLKASPTKKTDNKIYYEISPVSIDTPKLYSKLNSMISGKTLSTSPTDNITGVDAITNKYLGVYELDGDRVVKFKQLTLTEKNIKPPTKVILSNESLTGLNAGDGKITGLTIGKRYKVMVEDKSYGVKADGTLGMEDSVAETLIGTEITGLINGKSYMVEVIEGS